MRHSLLSLGLLALAPLAASAHALLDSASPSVGSTVPPTDMISLHYSEGVEPHFSTITISPDGGGPALPSAKPETDPADNTVLRVHVDTILRPGRYRVEWHVVSVDTHRTQGSFAFTVAAP